MGRQTENTQMLNVGGGEIARREGEKNESIQTCSAYTLRV